MAATITSKLDLYGQGISSDVLQIGQIQTLDVQQPTVESGALTLTTAYQMLGNMDGIQNGKNYLYIKNTDTLNKIHIKNGFNQAASGYIVFTGVPTATNTLTIEDTAGTTKVYVAASVENLTTRNFANTDPLTAATSLKDCIEASDGHAGTINCTLGGNGAVGSVCASSALTLTQATGGLAGNTTITPSAGLLNTCVTSFTLGSDNTQIPMGLLEPGQWGVFPLDERTVINIAAASSTATCEYGYWTRT